MTKPLLVEIIAHAPTAFYHCAYCEVAWQTTGLPAQVRGEEANESLPPDLAAQYHALSTWARDLVRRYAGRVAVQVVDAASPAGLFKALRYGVRRYPAVVVDRRARFAGSDLALAEAEIARRLGEV